METIDKIVNRHISQASQTNRFKMLYGISELIKDLKEREEILLKGIVSSIGIEKVKDSIMQRESDKKIFHKSAVISSVCCNSHLKNFNAKYNECFVCGKLHEKQTDL